MPSKERITKSNAMDIIPLLYAHELLQGTHQMFYLLICRFPQIL